MSVVSLEGLRFSGFAWTFKLVPSKHLETSMWHAGPLDNAF